jgi:copper chaperone
MSKELKFKTNINCGSCVKSVSGFLNEVESIESWEVDTANADKILTVKGAAIEEKEILDTVYEAGFDISPLPH